MAIVSTISNHFKAELLKGNVDLDAHTLDVILMDNTFAFDKDTHATYSDFIANEYSGTPGMGYTVSGETVVSGEVTEDDVNDRASWTCSDITWTASGESLGPIGSAMVHVRDADVAMGCIDFGEDITVSDGISFTLKDIALRLS